MSGHGKTNPISLSCADANLLTEFGYQHDLRSLGPGAPERWMIRPPVRPESLLGDAVLPPALAAASRTVRG